MFLDPLALSRPDDGIDVEHRWITVGLSAEAKLLPIVHTDVEVDDDVVYIGLISARKPSKRERRQYEQAPPEG